MVSVSPWQRSLRRKNLAEKHESNWTGIQSGWKYCDYPGTMINRKPVITSYSIHYTKLYEYVFIFGKYRQMIIPGKTQHFRHCTKFKPVFVPENWSNARYEKNKSQQQTWNRWIIKRKNDRQKNYLWKKSCYECKNHHSVQYYIMLAYIV